MAVVIRLKRTGRRNRPCYRISVADSRSPRDGRTLDNLGVYDPVCHISDKQLTVDVDKARDWITRGAVPSDTVRSLLKRQGVYADWDGVKPKTPRKRPGRKGNTATHKRRLAEKAARAEAKGARRAEREAAKKAAAAAAAEGASEE